MPSTYRKFKKLIGLKKKLPQPVGDPNDRPEAKLQRLLDEIIGPLSEQAAASSDPSFKALWEEAKDSALRGAHGAADTKVRTLKRYTAVTAELKVMRDVVSERADGEELAQFVALAQELASAGSLDAAAVQLELVKNRMLDPQAALAELKAELQGDLTYQVGQQPEDIRGELAHCLNGALAAAQAGKLDDTRARFASLKVRLNDDAIAEARKQKSVEAAMKAYLAQLRHQADAQLNPDGMFNLERDVGVAVYQADKLQQVMQTTGLSEVEVLAIAMYTGDDYRIMNPAIANTKDHPEKQRNGKDWMDQNAPDPNKFPPSIYNRLQAEYDATRPNPNDEQYKDNPEQYQQDLKEHLASYKSKEQKYEQGSLHAAFALAALKKLPAQAATTYRGMRMTPVAFEKLYKRGVVITEDAFSSQTTDRATAEGFANGDGTVPIKSDQTVYVLVTIQVFEARDIQAISVHEAEQELLLLPGTMYRVDRIEDVANGPVGRNTAPPATAWKHVYMTQTYRKA
jgi:hypothetical protein